MPSMEYSAAVRNNKHALLKHGQMSENTVLSLTTTKKDIK